jgi:hypothetical protein
MREASDTRDTAGYTTHNMSRQGKCQVMKPDKPMERS